jgi:glycosyltransferase involved in cell wall biosynthesis
MAAHRPIVSTAVGGVPKVAADGEAAFLVPPQDSIALANACIKILQDPLYAQTLAAAGFERVKKYYSLEAMIGKTLKLYEELLENYGAHTSS